MIFMLLPVYGRGMCCYFLNFLLALFLAAGFFLQLEFPEQFVLPVQFDRPELLVQFLLPWQLEQLEQFSHLVMPEQLVQLLLPWQLVQLEQSLQLVTPLQLEQSLLPWHLVQLEQFLQLVRPVPFEQPSQPLMSLQFLQSVQLVQSLQLMQFLQPLQFLHSMLPFLSGLAILPLTVTVPLSCMTMVWPSDWYTDFACVLTGQTAKASKAVQVKRNFFISANI